VAVLIDWVLRMRSLFRRGAVERELDEELAFHIEQQITALMRQGVGRDEAIRRARLEFGGLDQIKEEHRDVRGIRLADDLARDVRHALRQISRSPGFALLAVLCLGFGIGVNTTIFGVINSVLLRPMPIAEPERLVTVSRGESDGLSYPSYRDFQARTRLLTGLTAAIAMESDLDVDGESEFVVAEVVAGNYAEVLGVGALAGRWFADDRDPVAVISHAVWENRFNLDPQVVGRQIRSESQSYTIAGVAPREFTGIFAPFRTDIWVPIRTRPQLAAQLEERARGLKLLLFGRLREGATVEQASAELNAIDAQLPAQAGVPQTASAPVIAEHVRGVPNPGRRRLMARLTTLMAGVVGLVLLIACVNVGNLLLVRGALRRREFAVRRALGASSIRLFRQLLTESLVLAIAGGAAGVVLAVWTNKLLELSLPRVAAFFAVQLNLSIDWRVIAFATVISVVTTVACGLRPAWRASRARGVVALKSEIGGALPRRRPLGLVAQVIMSLVLLFVAGSFLQALLRLQTTDPGFDVDGRLYAYSFVPSSQSTAESRRELYSQAIERLRALPGVRRAALTSSLPLMPTRSECASLDAGPQIRATANGAGVGYFGTMGIDILAGRDFAVDDVGTDPPAVVINESLSRRLWPHGAAGRERIMIGCDAKKRAVVIGVVRDSAIRAIGEVAQPHVYRPYSPEDSGSLTAILLETSTDPAGIVLSVRRTLLGLGHGIRVYAVRPLAAHVDQSYAQFRWIAVVLTGFGLAALVLASIGLYGVIAYRVTLRTPEIGVRMALGATRLDIFREVVSQGLAIVLVGVAIGEVLTAVLTALVGSVQEGIVSTGLSSHVAVGLIWIAVAFIACYLPAARAARIDPLVALRHE
jgi:putative ABC transport system permease protein